MKFTIETPIGEILDNPAAREAMEKAMPTACASPFVEGVRHLSVYYIDNFAPGKFRKEEVEALKAAFEALGDV